MLNQNSLIKRSAAIVSCEIADGAALLDINTGQYFGLNNTSNFIWANLENDCSFSDLSQKMLAKYDVDEAILKRDLENVLANMSNLGFIIIT